MRVALVGSIAQFYVTFARYSIALSEKQHVLSADAVQAAGDCVQCIATTICLICIAGPICISTPSGCGALKRPGRRTDDVSVGLAQSYVP